ncbi:cytochrome c oxidase assembly protein [Kocuria rhizophila]|nr:cytochrome c oxidase assembly protein [Kocuria rhizophila]
MVAFFAVVYLWAAVKVWRRGDTWSPACAPRPGFVGLADRSTPRGRRVHLRPGAVLSADMVEHMTLTMIVPLFLVSGAPVTVVLKALSCAGTAPAAPASGPAAGVFSRGRSRNPPRSSRPPTSRSRLASFYFTDLFQLHAALPRGPRVHDGALPVHGVHVRPALIGIDLIPRRPTIPRRRPPPPHGRARVHRHQHHEPDHGAAGLVVRQHGPPRAPARWRTSSWRHADVGIGAVHFSRWPSSWRCCGPWRAAADTAARTARRTARTTPAAGRQRDDGRARRAGPAPPLAGPTTPPRHRFPRRRGLPPARRRRTVTAPRRGRRTGGRPASSPARRRAARAAASAGVRSGGPACGASCDAREVWARIALDPETPRPREAPP